jgi:hypothetical protein
MNFQPPFKSKEGISLTFGSESMEIDVSDDSSGDIQMSDLYDEDSEESELMSVGKRSHISKFGIQLSAASPLTVLFCLGHIDSLARKVESFILGAYPTSLASKVVQQALSYSKDLVFEIPAGRSHTPDRTLGHDTPCASCNKLT